MDVVRTAHQGYRLTLGGVAVDIVARKLKDGGLLCQVRICCCWAAARSLGDSLGDSPCARLAARACWHIASAGRIQGWIVERGAQVAHGSARSNSCPARPVLLCSLLHIPVHPASQPSSRLPPAGHLNPPPVSAQHQLQPQTHPADKRGCPLPTPQLQLQPSSRQLTGGLRCADGRQGAPSAQQEG